MEQVRQNPIQFAVVREDARLEAEVLRHHGGRRVLLIGSGGCTALTLQCLFPEASFTLVDPNAAQLDLIRRKQHALEHFEGAERHRLFNVGGDDPKGLSQCGNFESLFRGLRDMVYDLILPPEDVARLFAEPEDLSVLHTALFENPYWPVAFEMHFCDPLLEAMFGPDATQHAARGSYPGYFRALFERGLRAPGAADNPFLHHVFLGRYLERESALPTYLTYPAPAYRFQYVHGFMDAVTDLDQYDLVHLSNIFDWMAPDAVTTLVNTLLRTLRPGTAIIYRQLNNERDIEGLFGTEFLFSRSANQELLAMDRSLFYNSIHVGRRL